MMGHALPYYAGRIEEQGFTGVQDLLAYRIRIDFAAPRHLDTLISRLGERVRLRPLRRRQFAEDLAIIKDIFEDAWSNNWGFIPFTAAEFKHLGESIKFLIDEGFVQIAEADGAAAGMIVMIPNINEIIHDLNGRLFPFGWLKLLWRLKVHYPSSARVPLMGVRKNVQETLIGAALTFKLIEAVRQQGLRRNIREVELSWILEDNLRIRAVIEALGGRIYKRYRIYGKDLDRVCG